MSNVLMGDERKEELSFILDGDKWPMWPWLPVKRRPDPETNTGYETGMLPWANWDQDPKAEIRVLLVNMFQLREALESADSVPTETYPDWDAFFDAGWRGD